MKHFTKFLALGLVGLVPGLLLGACSEPREPSAQVVAKREAANQEALNKPEVVGTLPDGRVLYRALIVPCDQCFIDTVYWAGTDVTTVTHAGKNQVSLPVIGAKP
jgi:hypothetical protein